jgi:hypothetical protein
MNDLPKTIDEVLVKLDAIILNSINDNNYNGIFAYVYRRTTDQIKQAIIAKQFDDNERMELMDVRFANRYISAYMGFKDNLKISQSWMIPFASGHEKLTIMQHLLLGMNAHINLDLGIAASEIVGGNAIESIKNDFMKVNEILKSLTDEMQARVAKISGLMILLDIAGGNNDEAIMNFSIVKAREQAWEFARKLAFMDDQGEKILTEEVDTTISILAGIIKHPPTFLLKFVLKIIMFFEVKNVKKIIERLQA